MSPTRTTPKRAEAAERSGSANRGVLRQNRAVTPSAAFPRPRRLRLATIVCCVALLAGCGTANDAVEPVDLRERAALDTKLPANFPEIWEVPQSWTLVDGIEDGEVEGFGASAIWVSPDTFDETLATVQTLLTTTGWGPGTPDELVERDIRDHVIRIDNGTVKAIRLFSSGDIVGIQVTVDLAKAD